MLKSLKSNSYRFVVVLLLLLTFLTTCMVGKVIPSYALADPQPEFEPVYETEIVRLADYVDNTLQPEQQDIFYIMFGSYVVAQSAMSKYHIEDPYTTKDGVLGWFKSTGIQLYNTLVDQTAIMTPQILVQLGINNVIDFALGIAQKAGLYQSYNDFRENFNSDDLMLVPFNKSVQVGLNAIFAINDGLYNWQSEIPYEFTSNFTYSARDLEGILETEYLNAVNSNTIMPRHLCNRIVANFYNCVASTFNGEDKFDLFIDTDDHTIKFHTNNLITTIVGYNTNTGQIDTLSNVNMYFPLITYTPSWFSNYIELIQYFFNETSTMSTSSSRLVYGYKSYYFIFDPIPLLREIYIGVDWEHRERFSPVMTLNFEDDNIVDYLQVQNDYLFDLNGLVNSLINSIDLYGAIINNFFNPDGTLNINPSLIKVSIDLPAIEGTPALPVNLNDIAEYTDNEYLDIVKQRSLQASETIGEYVAFWHNCDSELVYAILGSFIVILIGAFIGKWGHS